MMEDFDPNFIRNTKPYIPSSLSAIYDFLATMLGEAPTFIDKTGFYPEQNIDTRFSQLTEAFGGVRNKLGEERYERLMSLSGRVKDLFLADPHDDNGKTLEGCKLIWEMEGIIRDVRKGRVKAELKDDEGEVTGD